MSTEGNPRFDLFNVSPGKRLPEVVNVIVEIPKGRRSKFEADKETGLIKLDRYLYSSSHYPGDYSFIPQTLAEDGDALDALVMVNEATFPGCLIEARVIGLFRMQDRIKPIVKCFAYRIQTPCLAIIETLLTRPRISSRRWSTSSGPTSRLKGLRFGLMVGWMLVQAVKKSRRAGSDGVRNKDKEHSFNDLACDSDQGQAAQIARELREGYSEFETGFRRQRPLLWWSSLLAPPLFSVVAVAVVWLSASPEYTRRLLTMALAALWFFGRFVILSGRDPEVAEYSGDMTSGELFLMVCWIDVMMAFFMAFHIGYLFRLPVIGPRIAGLVADARFILDAQNWVKRVAFFGVVAFVSFPLQATGSVGGSLFGRMLGMSRIAAFVATVVGSLLGNGLMYFGSSLINAFVDKNHPLVKYGGVMMIVVLIALMNWWYQRTKRSYLRSGQLPPNLSVDVSGEQSS